MQTMSLTHVWALLKEEYERSRVAIPADDSSDLSSVDFALSDEESCFDEDERSKSYQNSLEFCEDFESDYGSDSSDSDSDREDEDEEAIQSFYVDDSDSDEEESTPFQTSLEF
jgi:hypothetical protein